MDVAVDLRRSSATYGRHVTAELSAANWRQMLIPRGFAHGLLTLEPDTEVQYKVDAYYAPGSDAGVRWDDRDLGIEWPIEPDEVAMSEKDRALPAFADLPVVFD